MRCVLMVVFCVGRLMLLVIVLVVVKVVVGWMCSVMICCVYSNGNWWVLLCN